MSRAPVGKAKGERITRAPFDTNSAAAAYRAVTHLFARQRKRVLHNVHSEWARMAKADEPTPLWFWEDDAPEQEQAINEMVQSLRAAAETSGMHAFNAIGLNDPVHELPEGQVTARDIANRLTTFATDYASQRGAELVSGINETTRNRLNLLIRDATALHWSVDRLADAITDAGIFGDARATLVARTEISAAQNAATLEMGKLAADRGIDLKKGWTVGGDPCPLCQEAAALGVIDLDEDFGEAGDAPPLHPNCECNLDLFVADEEEEAKMQDDDTDDDRLDRDSDEQRHLVDQLADLLVEAGSSDGPVDRQTALQWLLHSRRGQALVTRMAQARKSASNRKKDSMMTRTETLTRIIKQAGGLAPLCQKIVKRGSADVTEAELTGMITAVAKHEYPDLDDARAFTRLFAGPGGELLRRAIMITKAAPLPEPPKVGGDDVDVNDPAKALAQLRAMIDELRRHAHNLTESEAWNRVVRDHPALAKRAIAA
jgi:hypothetical protein